LARKIEEASPTMQTVAVQDRLVQMLAVLGISAPVTEGAGEDEKTQACLDALDAEIHRMRAEAGRVNRSIAELSDVIAGFVAFDYSRRASFSGHHDALDGLAVCLNVLAEELGSSMVSKAYVSNIIESMADLLFVLDKSGNIKIANAAASRLSGYKKDELIGKPIGLLFPDIRADDILAQATVHRDEISCFIKSGRADIFSLSAAVMTNRRGEIEGIVCVARDLTEAKRSEEERIKTAEAIQRQAFLLQELSTPLIPITDHVLVMPLIGPIDQARAQAMCEALLHGVVSRQARMAIIDITGVRVVDELAIHGIIRAVQAVRLVGADVMLTGVRPQVAAALTHLEMDLSGLKTAPSLQSAVAAVLRR
jgi:rsbT co-antagonist protein RsbR